MLVYNDATSIVTRIALLGRYSMPLSFERKSFVSRIYALHFLAWNFKKLSRYSDSLVVQELNPNTIGLSGGKSLNTLCIVITSAVVVMDNEAYVKNCEGQLNNNEFYVKLDHDPTTNIVNEINTEIRSMLDKKHIDKKESQLLSEHLSRPRMSLFYGLPKIHKVFL